MTRKLLLAAFFMAIPGISFSADAIVWVKEIGEGATALKLSNIKILKSDGTTTEEFTIEGGDGSKLSIPLSAVKGIFVRGANIAVKTKAGKEYLIPMSQQAFSVLIGDNRFGGSTSFNTQYLSNIHFQ